MSTRKFRPGLGSLIKDAFAGLTGTARVYKHPRGSPERSVTRRKSPNKNRSQVKSRGRSRSLNLGPKELTRVQFNALTRVQQRVYSRDKSQQREKYIE
jgi:hypothetical protein